MSFGNIQEDYKLFLACTEGERDKWDREQTRGGYIVDCLRLEESTLMDICARAEFETEWEKVLTFSILGKLVYEHLEAELDMRLADDLAPLVKSHTAAQDALFAHECRLEDGEAA